LGASLAEVAWACEVNPNVLHRWRRELNDFGGRAFNGVRLCRLALVSRAGFYRWRLLRPHFFQVR